MFENFTDANLWFQWATLLYLTAFLLFLAAPILRNPGLWIVATLAIFGAFAMNTGLIADRWIEGGEPPFKTRYETNLLYPWCVSIVFFALLGLYRLKILGVFSAAISLIFFIYACAYPDLQLENMPPALQSGWFVPHVVAYFVAYAVLFASFVLAILALIFPGWRNTGSREGYEAYYNHAVNFGFTTLTIGLIFGAVWGKVAWGDYWSWDAKENWALITWLIYLAVIHMRYMSGWRGSRAAWVCIAGFCAVMFTYLGMKVLPAASGSLHVYQ